MADSGKTEQPTQRKLEKARKEGQFPSAKEFVSALQFMIFLGLLSSGGVAWFRTLKVSTRAVLASAFQRDLRPQDLVHLAWQLTSLHILPLVLAGLAVALSTLAIRLITTRFGLSLKKLAAIPATIRSGASTRETIEPTKVAEGICSIFAPGKADS